MDPNLMPEPASDRAVDASGETSADGGGLRFVFHDSPADRRKLREEEKREEERKKEKEKTVNVHLSSKAIRSEEKADADGQNKAKKSESSKNDGAAPPRTGGINITV